ncbi:MAG: hypothetical protein LBR54_02935, partial [Oscillospiraceae bacterium]|nr:hypothetical protein [Oscillospiraceae bacterium]
NAVNRILLSQSDGFTYQDKVYIENVLRKIGVTDIAQFMRQVLQLREDSANVYKILKVYERNIFRSDSAVNMHSYRASQPGVPDVRGGQSPPPRYTVHADVYKRLDTARIYDTVSKFTENRMLSAGNRMFHSELYTAEHLRAGNMIRLAEYNRMFLGEDTALTDHIHISGYETGEDMPAVTGEKDVLEQGAAGVLLNIADNMFSARIQRFSANTGYWTNISDAVYRSAEKSLNRFQSFRTQKTFYSGREKESRERQRIFLEKQMRLFTEHSDGGSEFFLKTGLKIRDTLNSVLRGYEIYSDRDLRTYRTENTAFMTENPELETYISHYGQMPGVYPEDIAYVTDVTYVPDITEIPDAGVQLTSEQEDALFKQQLDAYDRRNRESAEKLARKLTEMAASGILPLPEEVRPNAEIPVNVLHEVFGEKTETVYIEMPGESVRDGGEMRVRETAVKENREFSEEIQKITREFNTKTEDTLTVSEIPGFSEKTAKPEKDPAEREVIPESSVQKTRELCEAVITRITEGGSTQKEIQTLVSELTAQTGISFTPEQLTHFIQMPPEQQDVFLESADSQTRLVYETVLKLQNTRTHSAGSQSREFREFRDGYEKYFGIPQIPEHAEYSEVSDVSQISESETQRLVRELIGRTDGTVTLAEMTHLSQMPAEQRETVLNRVDAQTRMMYETLLKSYGVSSTKTQTAEQRETVLNRVDAQTGTAYETLLKNYGVSSTQTQTAEQNETEKEIAQRQMIRAEFRHLRPLSPEEELVLPLADESTRMIYKAFLQMQSDGYVPPDRQETEKLILEFNAQMRETQRESEFTHAARREILQNTVKNTVQNTVQNTEMVREFESVTRHTAPADIGYSQPYADVLREPAARVHKMPQEQIIPEQVIEQLTGNRNVTARETVNTQTVTNQTLTETQVNKLIQEQTLKSTEDISNLVANTIAKQMGAISERVYSDMERRLSLERARRGR